MKLNIITINYNNASGLNKTMESVFAQTSKEFEYIVIDGGSDDGSVEIIQQFTTEPNSKERRNNLSNLSFHYISEPDSGIYNAMNKGIQMAKGEYVQFLNSGDILAAADVTERMLTYLFPFFQGEGLWVRFGADILYGNMLKPLPRRILRDRGFAGRVPTMLDFYTGTLNHSSAYIRRSLFDRFGTYDETLKIVSDWKWYLKVIALNNVVPVYRNIDVSIFDMNGISSVNSKLEKAERGKVLEELLPLSVLHDYEQYAFPIEQLKRINRYWFTRTCFMLVERILFKIEKWFKIK